MGSIWAQFGLNLDSNWAQIGLNLDPIWAQFGLLHPHKSRGSSLGFAHSREATGYYRARTKKRNFRLRKLGAAMMRDTNALKGVLVLNVLLKRKRVVIRVQKRFHFSNGFACVVCDACTQNRVRSSCVIFVTKVTIKSHEFLVKNKQVTPIFPKTVTVGGVCVVSSVAENRVSAVV